MNSEQKFWLMVWGMVLLSMTTCSVTSMVTGNKAILISSGEKP